MSEAYICDAIRTPVGRMEEDSRPYEQMIWRQSRSNL